MKNTSIEAYRNKVMSGTIDNDYVKIYDLLRSRERAELTYCEIAYLLHWSNPNKVSRRTKEMVEIGLIEEREQRICTIAGSKCSTYTVS